MTLRVYAHVIRDQVAEAADVFARSVAAPVSKSVSKKPPAGGEVGRYLGALGGTRTPNLLIRSQMLYPLSYERSPCSISRPARWLRLVPTARARAQRRSSV